MDDKQERELNEAGQALIRAAMFSNAGEVKRLLKSEEAPAWYQDEIGWTALHYAAERQDEEMISVLLSNGGLWNAVDVQGYSPADVALSLNSTSCYELIASHGLRSEFLLSYLGGSSSQFHLKAEDTTSAGSTAEFLKSKLTYLKDDKGRERVVDEDGNGVMMRWEEGIMEETVKKLVEAKANTGSTDGLRILNVGFGLGIVDTLFSSLKPSLHTVIEPHPSVLTHMKESGWTTEQKPELRVLEGVWQDFIDKEEIMEGGGFDLIYFDTFSEGYDELKEFFEHLPDLLSGSDAVFSFFHGLGATNLVFHHTYTELSTMHLGEVGLEVEWSDLELDEEVKEEVWKGVKQKYWTLPLYRLPIARMKSN